MYQMLPQVNPSTLSSNHLTLSLPDANDPHISPHGDRHSPHGPNSRPRHQHHHLRLAIRKLNRDASGRSHRVRQLHRNVLVDGGQVGELGGGKACGELLGEDGLPDGGGDGEADGAAYVAECAQQGQGCGDVLMGRGGHGGDFVADDDGAGGEGDEDLAEDDGADILVGAAEADQEAQAQAAQGNAKVEADGLVASGVAYQQAHGEGGQDGADEVGLDDVAGIRHAEVVDHLQDGAEVAVPAVETEEQRSGQDASAKNGTVQEEGIGDECDGGEESLPDSEGDHECDARDQQGDDEGRAPPVRLQGVKVEWQEKESDAGGEQDETDGVELAAVVEQRPPDCALTLALRDETLLRGLGVIKDQEAEERKGDGGYENGECSKAPTPAGAP